MYCRRACHLRVNRVGDARALDPSLSLSPSLTQSDSLSLGNGPSLSAIEQDTHLDQELSGPALHFNLSAGAAGNFHDRV